MKTGRSAVRGSWLAACAVTWAVACGGGVDEELLPSDPTPVSRDGGSAGAPASDAASDSRDSGSAGASAGMGGMPTTTGGSGGAAETGGSGGASAPVECMENPDAADQACPVICPEACNDQDDDCDGRVDEGEAALACDAAHTSSICSGGECLVVECLDAYRDCNGDPADGCEVAPDDPAHCGVCGHACALENAAAICVDGACQVATCSDGFGDCDGDLTSCETATQSLQHCGACNTSCGPLANAEPTCAGGLCEPERCVGNYGDCDGDPDNGCELSLDSLDDCGGCGVPCDLGGGQDDCSAGVCIAVGCDPGYADCDQSATTACDSLNTPERCGACTTPCTVAALDNVTDTSCVDMTCNATCASGFGDCDGEPGCETALRSRTHCGACDTPCALDHAVASCATGSCEFVRCEDGFGDCNQDTSDGCEQPLDTLTHCGECDVACDLVSCAGGTCSSEACVPPMADCDLVNNDCEVDLSSTLAHCGGCNNLCGFSVPPAERHATLECANSACRAVCDAGFGDCDGDHENGCETPLNTLTDCGQCGMGCSAVNATPTCATGQCRVETCDPDWKDCDQDGRSCEREIDTVSDCGDCDAACNLDNAFAVCGGTANARACQIDQCTNVAFVDCDMQDATGCEIDTRSDVANCGACGNDCLAQPHVTAATCSTSACQPTGCEAAWGDCGPGAGCETPLDTIQSCGACGNDCNQLMNTQGTTCNGTTLACEITACDPGFASCDGSVSTGCETDILTPANCGGCASLAQNEPCTALPHVAQSSCGSGSCQIDACDSDWDDCDLDVGNGCERDLLVDGPCHPDTNCTRESFGDAIYFFCQNDNDWATARALCLTLTRGDLVSVESSAENAFLASHYTANAWLGARDAGIEGLWRWERTGVPFWQGLDTGSAQLGNFEAWDGPQPDDWMGAEDCAEQVSGGAWNDQGCMNARDFICEVIPDRCPTDATKLDPGQCGCGSPDTDADMDGFAVCNDACDDDAAKLAPGVCGCGIADTDADMDSFFDCEEICDFDPNKQDPGVCGCGVADIDTDSDGFFDCEEVCDDDPDKQDPGICGCGVPDDDGDGDGTPDCNDGCPSDPTLQVACFPFAHSNFDSDPIDFSTTPSSTLDCGDATIDTTDPDGTGPLVATITGWCGTAPTPVAQAQTSGSGPEIVVIPLRGLTVASGRSVTVIGSRPAVFAVRGDVSIAGTVTANASGATPGAGGNWSCTPATSGGIGGDGTGGPGSWGNSNTAGASGGGGGGFGTDGGRGGNSDTDALPGGGCNNCPGGAGGLTGSGEQRGSADLSPLLGGCPGGVAGSPQTCSPQAGGAGGGAVQITASGALVVSGALRANGGNGNTCEPSQEGGGTGGGSGGALLLEADSVNLTGAAFTANGGRGGANGSQCGIYGCGNTQGGSGSTSPSSNGSNGTSTQAGGSGGGGGYGRRWVNYVTSCTACP